LAPAAFLVSVHH